MTVILSLLNQEEFNKVDGLNSEKEIWDTLRVAREGTKTIRIAKIEMNEGELGRFMMEGNETPQEMYNRLKIFVNKIRDYRSKN